MRGVDDFRSWVAKTQLSGRRGPNFGLNRRSGRAFSRWLIVARQIRNIFAVTLTSRAINKGYGYLLSHQKRTVIRAKNPQVKLLTFKIGNRWIRKREVVIRKRITIFETFKQKMGFKFIEQNVRRTTDGLVHGV
jgi:hypothetical protein